VVLANLTGGDRVTTGRQVPYCLFTDPELARIGLSEREARERGVGYRLAKVPMEAVFRARTISETRGFLKALIEGGGDRILGFTAFGPEAGEVMAVVQVAMLAGLPYTALRDAVLTHPTMAEGLAAPCSRPCRRDDVQAARTSSGTEFVPQPRPSAPTGPPQGRRNDRSAIRPGLSRPAPGRG
jgi:hypothetical protein